jgi:Helix-hairpin-helix domain
MDELQKLTGIGAVTAQRLSAAGITTFAALVAAGEDGLRAIPGINPKAIPGILEQAASYVPAEEPAASQLSDDVKALAAELRSAMQEIAQAVRERFPEELTDKIGHKLTRNLVAGVDALYAIEELAQRRPKRSRRALEKMRARLDGLAGAELTEIRKGLKKARKGLERTLS